MLSCRGLCVGLITRPEEPHWVWCVWVWSWSIDIKGPGPRVAVMPLGGGAEDECKILSRISATGRLTLSFSLQIIDFIQMYVHLIISLSACFSTPDGWTVSNQCFEYQSWRREQRWFSKLWFTRCSTNWLGCQPDKISLNSVTLKASDYIHEIWHSETNARNHSVTQYFKSRWELIYFLCFEISALGPVVDFVLKETIQPVVAVRVSLRTRSHKRPFFVYVASSQDVKLWSRVIFSVRSAGHFPAHTRRT